MGKFLKKQCADNRGHRRITYSWKVIISLILPLEQRPVPGQLL